MNVEVGDGIYGSQRRHEFHEMLNASRTYLANIIQIDITRTFRDSKETEEHNAVAMCASDIITYVTNR